MILNSRAMRSSKDFLVAKHFEISGQLLANNEIEELLTKYRIFGINLWMKKSGILLLKNRVLFVCNMYDTYMYVRYTDNCDFQK